MTSPPLRRARVEAGALQKSDALGFDSLFGALAWAGALLLLLVAPSQIANFWPGDYNFWPQALFTLLLAGVAILLAISRLPAPKIDGVAACLSLFLGWSFLTTFTATYAHDAWLELARIAGALAFFFIVRAFTQSAQKLGLIAAATLGVTYLGALALFNFVQTHDPRQFGTFLNPNLFANALALAIPLSIALPLAIWNLWRNRNFAIASALPFLILLPALAVTSSKGGLLAALLGSLATITAIRAARPAAFGVAFRKMLPAVLVLALIFGALAAKTVLPRLLAARGADDNSTMFRVYLWRGTIKMIEARPIVGFGPGAFSGSYPQFAPAGTARSAHESWLQIAAESGVPALLLLAATAILALRNGARARRDEGWALRAGAMGALLAMIVHGCFDAGWGATPVVILLALSLGLLQLPPPQRADLDATRGNLNLGWIGATLLLALAGFGTQQAAQGQDAYDESQRLLELGSRAQALQKAEEAVAIAPGSSRLQSNLGYMQSANGSDGDAALQRAVALQPDRSANYLTLARVADAHNRPDLYEKWMSLALQKEPLSSYFLLSRAKFRLQHKDARGLRRFGIADGIMGRAIWTLSGPRRSDKPRFRARRGVVGAAPQTNRTSRARA